MSIGLYIVLAPLYLKSVRKLQEKRFVFVKILAIIIPENGAKVSKIKCFQFAQQTLFTNDCFKDLSSDAKILYGLMLDRMSLSIKNQWFDEENRAYIYFSIEDIMELLNCGRNKAVKSLQELDDEKGIGLIEKRRQGFGKVTIIYVKSFIQEECEEEKKEKSKMVKFTNQTSRSPKNKLQEVPKINFKKFTFQTLIILILTILILVRINLIISYLQMG